MKRGSALLIVLGMMAFIIISAVAFSAWMRYNRLPSSYLRRTSSARLLAKAALAEAIDIVDASIGNNPHPGIGGTQNISCWYPSRQVASQQTGAQKALDWPLYNTWRNRVYVGTNTTQSLLASCDTVSTLTAEALAYLPPALINEARYYSRHSYGGTWHDMNYGAGRFAFCAVDVSDYLDINRIPANMGRSSLPESRFSLAHVFGKADQTDYAPGCDPSKWDDFMENFVDMDAIKGVTAQTSGQQQSQTGSKLPLTSLADWNLALWNKDNTLAQMLSPFCRYFSGSGGDELVTTTAGDAAEMLRRATFVTDGWYPTPPAAAGSGGGTGGNSAQDYDLADDANQPFDMSMLQKDNKTAIRTIIEHGSPAAKRLKDKISGLGLVSLFDYLDEDNVPVSLAIPQVERTPMVCGIRNDGFEGMKIAFKDEGGKKYKFLPEGKETSLTGDDYPADWGGVKATQDGQKRKIRYTREYRIDAGKFAAGIQGGMIKAILAYPFRSSADTAKPDTFNVDGHVEFFFTVGDFKFRTENKDDLLHLEDETTFTQYGFSGNSVIHVPLQPQQFSIPEIGEAKDALGVLDFPLRDKVSDVSGLLESTPFVTVTFEEEQTASKVPDSDPPQYIWQRGESSRTEGIANIAPIGQDGNAAYANSAAVLKALNDEPDVTLRMAVWLRVKNGDNQTVDLVPASLNDDNHFGLGNNYQAMSSVGNDMSGAPNPVMWFTLGTSFKYSETAFDSLSDISVAVLPQAVMCPDPRWNWAPEHWFANDTVTDGQTWLQNCGVGASAQKDEDIFMATSDAGYMQSVYELAFLPRLTNLESYGTDDVFGNLQSPGDGRIEWATELAGVRNWQGTDGVELMWRTYCPYARNGVARDLFEFEGGGFVTEGGGVKVNPYSDSANVIMAAFANTPLDWWVASACDRVRGADVKSELKREDAKEFNKHYAFTSLDGADVQFAWGHLQKIAEQFNVRARELAKETAEQARKGEETNFDHAWQDAFDEIFAQDATKNFLGGVDVTAADPVYGKTTDPLFAVDRRFLYGYWHDCFAVRQQLFLIFVRAEPSMMGGGSVRETPPSLGARAVALVWRDPSFAKPMAGDQGTVVPPHRTRVLFYRQFE